MNYQTTLTHVHEDGHCEHFLTAHCKVAISGDAIIDVIAHDAAGNVISDTRQQREEKNERLSVLIHKYCSDDSLKAMLQSFSSALHNPNNELMYLYEIRDVICSIFGDSQKAQATLNLDKKTWSQFGLICNVLPLNQGRHRGVNPSNLRDATETELSEARSIAISWIEAYLQHIDQP